MIACYENLLGSLDVFVWHVWAGPSVATDLRTIGGENRVVLDFHIQSRMDFFVKNLIGKVFWTNNKMPSKSILLMEEIRLTVSIPDGSPHGLFEKSRELKSFRIVRSFFPIHATRKPCEGFECP